MRKATKLLGLAAVGVSLLGAATAYWRRNHTPPPARPANVQVSRAIATPPRTKPSKYQEEQIEQVKKHQE
jgi:hypothetical protein